MFDFNDLNSPVSFCGGGGGGGGGGGEPGMTGGSQTGVTPSEPDKGFAQCVNDNYGTMADGGSATPATDAGIACALGLGR